MEIRSKEIILVPIEDIKLDPNNRNKHPPEQIEQLVDIIKYQGFRVPVTISNQTGIVRAGAGRYLAAQKLGMTHIPAIYQDFDSPEQEYAHGVSDNAISLWAQLDLAGINNDLGDLGPDFNIDLLGIKDFSIDTPIFKVGTEEEQGKLDELTPLITQCPNCGECFNANENKPSDVASGTQPEEGGVTPTMALQNIESNQEITEEVNAKT
jgi:hypothetical protein